MRIYLLIWEREDGGERERNSDVRNINWLPTICALTRDGTRSLGMCPDQELNLQPFDAWDDVPTHWATWPGPKSCFLRKRLASLFYAPNIWHWVSLKVRHMLEVPSQIPASHEQNRTTRISKGQGKNCTGSFSSSVFTAAFYPDLVGINSGLCQNVSSNYKKQ